MELVGHRGAPGVARENTLPSLRAALELGADWIEVDVRLARCGTPVLLHDATLERLWGLPRRVGELTAAELAALPGPDPADAASGGVPSLRQGLELAAAFGATVMVDLPEAEPEPGAAALALVRELGRLPAVVFAGNRTALLAIRAACPEARIALSWESPLLPPAQLLEAVRPEYLNVEHHRLTRWLVRRARARGLAVSTWTVDRPRRAARLAALGVDVLITNRPAELLLRLGRAVERIRSGRLA